jgi:hypothetical protein
MPNRDSRGRFVSGPGSGGGGGSFKFKVDKIVWHDDAITKFLKTDPGIHDDLERRSTAVRDAAGGPPDFRSAVEVGRDRQRAAVWTWTRAAQVSEAAEHALLRALDAAR